MKSSEKSPAKENSRQIDLLCFCHLRWDFVYQRPQHLMTRLAKKFRVFFIEEPLYHTMEDSYKINATQNVYVITPFLKENYSGKKTIACRQKILLDKLCTDMQVQKFISWYYTPMALNISNHLQPEFIIYDCMDELSAFKFAPPELKLLEAELLKKAQLVFTGGQNLYKAKKQLHHNIFPFPSSIDKNHFQQARASVKEPVDQAKIPPLRFGFYGVIDERFNIKLIAEVADRKPEWQFILVGPVVKINEADLPRKSNIHYLGNKCYKDLPEYLSGWNIAMIPFEKNESTEYISPTKTPEYLAAGVPVISTSIADVVDPYGKNKLVHIADTADEFIAAAIKEITSPVKVYEKWLQTVDIFLANISWDNTIAGMMLHIDNCMEEIVAAKATLQVLKSVA